LPSYSEFLNDEEGYEDEIQKLRKALREAIQHKILLASQRVNVGISGNGAYLTTSNQNDGEDDHGFGDPSDSFTSPSCSY